MIGSGISGLTTAACLSRVGRRVLVLEQHDRLGGCLHQYHDTYQFDTGIHYVGKASFYQKLFQPLTAKDKKVEFVAIGNKENGYVYDKYLIGSGDQQKIFQARANTRKQDLKKQFNTKQDIAAIDKFYGLQKDAKSLSLLVMAGKILELGWLSQLLFKIGKWKYPQLWNKSAYDVFKMLFSKNQLLGMSIFANIGDLGGKMRRNAAIMTYGLFDHYKKGGYFINGGPTSLVRSMMPVIEASGGRCLANASVQKIIFENNRAVGVVVKPSKRKQTVEFKARCGVICTAGFRNLYTKFAPVESLPKTVSAKTKLNIQRVMNTVEPSAQHFHIFLGFDKTAKELDFPQTNRWYLSFDNGETKNGTEFDYDSFIEKFHKDPLNAPCMGFLSFPSAKNPQFENESPGKATAIIITEVPYYHFEKWKDCQHDARGDDYIALKEKIADRMIEELLFKYYPKARGHLAQKDVGTALSAQFYLGATIGESYGLEHCCDRYFDYDINQLLKPRQPVKGLWLAGQDVLSCGFASAFQSGIWCAEQILGYHKFTVLASGRNLIKDLNKMDGYKDVRKEVEAYDYKTYA